MWAARIGLADRLRRLSLRLNPELRYRGAVGLLREDRSAGSLITRDDLVTHGAAFSDGRVLDWSQRPPTMTDERLEGRR